MAKLALVFIAVFFFVQFVAADVETTTPNLLDTIKTGIENTFSEDNIKKAVDNLNDLGGKVMGFGSKVIADFQNALKKEDTPTTPAP